MTSIFVTHGEGVKTKYNLLYNGKKLKKNKEIKLNDNSFILLKEKNIFLNRLVCIFCWIVMIFYWLYIFIFTMDIDPEIKPLKKIQINYNKVLNEEITIKILKDKVEVTGLEIESIVIDGIKMGEPQNSLILP